MFSLVIQNTDKMNHGLVGFEILTAVDCGLLCCDTV
jgi:hypothetical protein